MPFVKQLDVRIVPQLLAWARYQRASCLPLKLSSAHLSLSFNWNGDVTNYGSERYRGSERVCGCFSCIKRRTLRTEPFFFSRGFGGWKGRRGSCPMRCVCVGEMVRGASREGSWWFIVWREVNLGAEYLNTGAGGISSTHTYTEGIRGPSSSQIDRDGWSLPRKSYNTFR